MSLLHPIPRAHGFDPSGWGVIIYHNLSVFIAVIPDESEPVYLIIAGSRAIILLPYQSGDGREVGRDPRLLPVEADVAHVVLGRQRILKLASRLFHGGPAVLHYLVLAVRAAVEYLRRGEARLCKRVTNYYTLHLTRPSLWRNQPNFQFSSTGSRLLLMLMS